MIEFLRYFVDNIDKVGSLLYNHIQYTLIAVLLAVCIGIPLGITIYNSVQMRKPVLGFANLVQAIPSLAILGFIVPYFGIGASTAIFMVVIYSLLPILKNTYTGLSNINPDTLEAAKGIGMTPWQILRQVQIPLALPVIMAGIRISAVTAVGLMTIAAYIGADVLGSLVISGIQTLNSYSILSGAIPACLLALTIDFLMGKVEKAVTPISLQTKASNLTPKAVQSMKRTQRGTIITAICTFVLIIGIFVVTALQSAPDITVGSKDAVEGNIVGNIYAEAIEQKTDLNVERRMGLGGTAIAYAAVQSNEIGLYPEYTGTLYASVLGETYDPGTDSETIYNASKEGVYAVDGISVLDPSTLNSTYVMAVSQEIADTYGLKTISDLAKVAGRLTLGSTAEFAVRDDGLLGLQDAYDLEFKSVVTFNNALMYAAIGAGEVDCISGISTDSMVATYNLVPLEDDMNFFPPYNLVPVVSRETYNAYPEIVPVLNDVSAMLNDDNIRILSGYVVNDGMDYDVVARNFLIEEGYIDP